MPIFRTTYNIFTKPWEDESWDDNWMNSNKIELPPNKEWDYSKELTISDVSLWEVIYQASGGVGVYASWDPLAEFYMVTDRFCSSSNDSSITTYYGAGADKKVREKMRQLQIPFTSYKIWVEPEDMWLYDTNMPKTLIVP